MELPDYGQWHLTRNPFAPRPPFLHLSVSFVRNAGAVQGRRNSARLRNVMRLSRDRFAARYRLGSDHGEIHAVLAPDRTLSVQLSGTVNCEYRGLPTRLLDVEQGGKR